MPFHGLGQLKDRPLTNIFAAVKPKIGAPGLSLHIRLLVSMRHSTALQIGIAPFTTIGAGGESSFDGLVPGEAQSTSPTEETDMGDAAVADILLTWTWARFPKSRLKIWISFVGALVVYVVKILFLVVRESW